MRITEATGPRTLAQARSCLAAATLCRDSVLWQQNIVANTFLTLLFKNLIWFDKQPNYTAPDGKSSQTKD